MSTELIFFEFQVKIRHAQYHIVLVDLYLQVLTQWLTIA